MGIGQTEQTKIWVLARPNRPNFGYWPDRTGRNLGIGQTEQTEIWVFAGPNRLKLPLARRKARPKFLPDHCGRSHRTPLSATQVGLANTCLGSRTSSWACFPFLLFCIRDIYIRFLRTFLVRFKHQGIIPRITLFEKYIMWFSFTSSLRVALVLSIYPGSRNFTKIMKCACFSKSSAQKPYIIMRWNVLKCAETL